MFEEYRIQRKVIQLQLLWSKLSRSKREVDLNKIDEQVISLLLSIERNCRKLRTGAVSFLPKLSKLGLTWRFWRKVAHFKRSLFFDEGYLKRTALFLRIEFYKYLSIEICIEELKEEKVIY